MKKLSSICLALSAALVSACGGGGGDAKSSCQSIGSATNDVVLNGSVSNIQNVGDGNLTTFASYTAGAPAGYLDSQGNQFPGGSNAGVFLTPPPGTSASDITVSTFVGSDSTMTETATGATLTITKTGSDPATEYASFKTTLPFSGVKLTVNTANTSPYLVYEFCGSATVH